MTNYGEIKAMHQSQILCYSNTMETIVRKFTQTIECNAFKIFELTLLKKDRHEFNSESGGK